MSKYRVVTLDKNDAALVIHCNHQHVAEEIVAWLQEQGVRAKMFAEGLNGVPSLDPGPPTREDELLVALSRHPYASQVKRAEILGWRTKTGHRDEDVVYRIMRHLVSRGLVRKKGRIFILTSDGQAVVEKVSGFMSNEKTSLSL